MPYYANCPASVDVCDNIPVLTMAAGVHKSIEPPCSWVLRHNCHEAVTPVRKTHRPYRYHVTSHITELMLRQWHDLPGLRLMRLGTATEPLSTIVTWSAHCLMSKWVSCDSLPRCFTMRAESMWRQLLFRPCAYHVCPFSASLPLYKVVFVLVAVDTKVEPMESKTVLRLIIFVFHVLTRVGSSSSLAWPFTTSHLSGQYLLVLHITHHHHH